MLGMELELNILSSAIDDNGRSIVLIQQEINKLKDIYARLIRNLYLIRSPKYRGMYFFAAENLNQLYKRISVIKLYNGYLRSRRNKLESLGNELIRKNKELEKLRLEKDVIVKSVRRESEIYLMEINEKKKVVTQLKQKQKDIENEIRAKEKTANKLENELKKLIEEERKRSKMSGTEDVMTPEEKIISSDFEKNLGSLPWPTENGIITGKYGEHQHPDYKFVIIRNDGIYITTTQGEIARSIFKGVVSRVFTIPGENQTVIIKHGLYYTLYHNLVKVKVKAGQNVGTKELIGTVYTNEKTKETVLYLQVWKETERKDPELWLAN